ncbi:unnamed protein product [Urochloa humidicola]
MSEPPVPRPGDPGGDPPPRPPPPPPPPHPRSRHELVCPPLRQPPPLQGSQICPVPALALLPALPVAAALDRLLLSGSKPWGARSVVRWASSPLGRRLGGLQDWICHCQASPPARHSAISSSTTSTP